MDLSFITDFYMPIVVIACLAIGYCIKHITWLDKISNIYIPAIMLVLGAVFGCITNSGITFENMVYGAISGLASTGLHQTFSKLIDKTEEK